MRAIKLAGLALLAGLSLATPVVASNCSGYPNILLNGTLADANQVMANFNAILACANSNLAHNGVNSDITQLLSVTNLAFAPANSNITSLTGLTTPLAVSEGGTGANNASNARTNLGLGTAAVENLLGTVIDSGGNLIVGNSGVTAGSYTNPTVTIGADGRISSATSGTGASTVATAGQMETATSLTVYAAPGVVQYAPSAIKAWVTFIDNGGISLIHTQNVASVSGSSGTYTITLSGGLIFTAGGILCGGEALTNNPLFSGGEGGLTGTNPSVIVDFKNSAGSLAAPSQHATCAVYGVTNN